MKTFREYVMEAVRYLPDEKMDRFIKNKWSGEAITFHYDPEAIMEIAKIVDDVLITKDKKFFHIPEISDRRLNNQIAKILLKYDVKEAMNESVALYDFDSKY